MIRLLSLLIMALPGLALAQQAPAPAMRGENITVLPSGATTARSLAARFAERLNLRDFGAAGNGAADDSAALDAAIARSNALRATGIFVCIYVPPGDYRIVSQPRAFSGPGCIMGDGPQRSYLRLDQAFTGTLITFSESWMGNSYLSSNATIGVGPAPGRTGPTTNVMIAGQLAGTKLQDVAIIGDRRASGAQHAIDLRDRNDFVLIRNVDCHYVPGRCIYAGATRDQAQAYLRESHIDRFRAFVSGAAGFPVIDLTSTGTGDATNEVTIDRVDIYAPAAQGVVIRANSGVTNFTRYIRMRAVRIEGDQNNPLGISVPLLQIGDSASDGRVLAVYCTDCEFGSPYTGSYAVEMQPAAGRGTESPGSVQISGRIFTGAGAGGGVNIAGGTGATLRLSGLTSATTNITVAGSSVVAGPILIDGGGAESGWTYAVDGTSTGAVQVPLRSAGNPSAGVNLAAPTATFGALTIGAGGVGVSGGSVTSISFSNAGSYTGAVGVPTLTIAAPPAGGAQATAVVSAMRFSQFVGGSFLSGAGCSVNDILTIQGGTADIPTSVRVTAVDGSGRPTAQTATGGGNTSGNYTVLPPDIATFTGGTCTTAPTARVAYFIFSTTITSAGSGYQTNPAVTATSSAFGTASGTGAVSTSLPFSAASGSVTLDGAGTRLGLAGASGGPIVMQSAIREGAVQRLTPTNGGSTTVSANTGWVRFVNTSVIASHTMFLIGAQGDGQLLRISSVGGITALTIGGTTSQGWTNGAALPANTWLTFAWDATRSVWDRVQ